MIYALSSRNLVVEIYALFPQNILDWGPDSANFFAFWMYAHRRFPPPLGLHCQHWRSTGRSTVPKIQTSVLDLTEWRKSKLVWAGSDQGHCRVGLTWIYNIRWGEVQVTLSLLEVADIQISKYPNIQQLPKCPNIQQLLTQSKLLLYLFRNWKIDLFYFFPLFFV